MEITALFTKKKLHTNMFRRRRDGAQNDVFIYNNMEMYIL